MITHDEVKVLDANAAARGVPTSTLMENAGKGIAETLIEEYDLKDRTVLVLCGTGNNGGDGLVAARHLRKVCKVKVFLVDEPKTLLAKANLNKVKGLVLPGEGKVEALRSHVRSADFIIDALLGVGLEGELRQPYPSLISLLNSAKAKVIAVDVPTGLGTKTVVRPDITVTFHDRKEGMTKENSGKIVVVDIGIPIEASTYTGPGEPLLIPKPGPDTHKGMRGNLLVVGGGPYYGAPALAGLAAQRCGIDLVYLTIPETIVERIASHSLNFIIRPLEGGHITEDHVATISEYFKRATAMVLGPGIGEESNEAVLELIKSCPLPMVVDADALKAIAGHEKELRGADIVFTPHAGEFLHLTGERPKADLEQRAEQVRIWAKRLNATILLKGHIDLVSDGVRIKRNATGNEAMAVGGTGDVLTGITGTLLAKGMVPFDAARVAAYLNGKAGDAARARLGHSLTATDVIESIPEVLSIHVPWWR
jgi:NAD(P)H-hydrate epimerase